jgi:DNA-binding NarL/FixJ family response regulator
MPVAPSRQNIRVAVLDDHEVVLRGVTQELAKAPDIEVIGALHNTEALTSLLRTQACDVAVLDFSLSGNDLDGINLIRFLRARFPDTKIILFSAHNSAPNVDLSIRAGASSFFPKSEPLSGLIPVIRSVHRCGSSYTSPTHGSGYRPDSLVSAYPVNTAERMVDSKSHDIADALKLSPREQEVVRCCLEGLSLSDTARKFSRSVKTVSNQKQSAFRKLGIRTLGELFKIQEQLKK